MREELIIDHPCGQLIPLVQGSAINGNPPFHHLILARLEISDDFFGDLGEVSAVDVIVCFQEDRPKTRFPDRVILEVELVETMKRILVGL